MILPRKINRLFKNLNYGNAVNVRENLLSIDYKNIRMHAKGKISQKHRYKKKWKQWMSFVKPKRISIKWFNRLELKKWMNRK